MVYMSKDIYIFGYDKMMHFAELYVNRTECRSYKKDGFYLRTQGSSTLMMIQNGS